MKLAFTAILLTGFLAIASPLSAAQPDNFFEADGCDVMVYVESLDPGPHTGSWRMQSVLSGEMYTYTYDEIDVLSTFSPDGLSGRLVAYVNWRLIELGAKGTNRTDVRFDLTQPVWPFDFDGQIIRGTRFGEGGIGGTGTFDPATGDLVWTAVTHVFCQGHR